MCAPLPSQSSRHRATMSSLVGSSTWCAPKSDAYCLRIELTSETMIFSQPRALSAWMTERPMGPPPIIKAESPAWYGEMLTACQPTDRGSTKAMTISQVLRLNLCIGSLRQLTCYIEGNVIRDLHDAVFWHNNKIGQPSSPPCVVLAHDGGR